jgi:5-methylcytosine-specific restriction endonuclease McrA
MTEIERFQQQHPSDDSYWRSIILFGRNVASYKFALSKSLLEILPTSNTVISLDELAEPFSRFVCEHIANAPRQSTSASSKFLSACRKYNQGEASKESLLNTTVQLGFNNVIDAFHMVNEGSIPKPFFEKDFSSRRKNIILTDEIFRLQEIPFFDNLKNETESRWRLVETAWELGISKHLLGMQYDDEQQLLFVNQDIAKRKDVTSARDALNGYQKGKCFYCNDDISLVENGAGLCDVDHFYPYMLQPYLKHINLNGIWNLVLACKECNRGAYGKFARIPEPQYLDKLHSRNEYLITSHHPLRETIMAQTGGTEALRIQFISNVDQSAIDLLIHRWGTALKGVSVI